jgi:hypothetical protein
VTVSALRAAWQAERRAARRVAWALRLSAFGFAVAYLVTVIALRRLDPYFLVLTLGTLVSSASQFLFIERYRVPACVTERLTGAWGPAERGETWPHVEALWPEVRSATRRGARRPGPANAQRDEIAALTLAEAVTLVVLPRIADATRRRGRAGSCSSAVIAVLALLAGACLPYTPRPRLRATSELRT